MANSSAIEALVFDFDGVMVDTELPEFESWSQMFQSHGVELDRELWANSIGRGRAHFDVYQHLEDLKGSPIDREAVQSERRRRYEELVAPNPLLPGVVEYMDEADAMGLRLGVASSSTREWVEGHLKPRGVLDRFETISTGDEAENSKPDPEIYLTALDRLGARPERAIAIEDSANGLTSAKRAGMFCVAVPNRMTREMDLSQADVQLEALTDMSLAELVEAASNR
jgi:HAD superfamily hydrolase (TIGR01509 family)